MGDEGEDGHGDGDGDARGGDDMLSVGHFTDEHVRHRRRAICKGSQAEGSGRGATPANR